MVREWYRNGKGRNGTGMVREWYRSGKGIMVQVKEWSGIGNGMVQ